MQFPNIKIENVKLVANMVVARSVSGVIVTMVHQNTTTHSKGQTAQLYIGAYVLGAMVADRASTYVENQIDAAADQIAKFKDRNNADPK